MTTTLLIILCLGFAGLNIYFSLKYAKANYPQSLKWLFMRFGTAFVCGVLIGTLLFSQELSGLALIAVVVLTGIAFGILLTFVLEYRLRYLIPKNKGADDKAR